jgi:hypothetical protein
MILGGFGPKPVTGKTGTLSESGPSERALSWTDQMEKKVQTAARG